MSLKRIGICATDSMKRWLPFTFSPLLNVMNPFSASAYASLEKFKNCENSFHTSLAAKESALSLAVAILSAGL